MDDRIEKLADILTTHSVTIHRGSYVHLEYGIAAKPLALAIYKRILQKGGIPVVDVIVPDFERVFYEHASDEQLNSIPLTAKVKTTVDASIRIYAPENTRDLMHIKSSKIAARRKVTFPFKEEILKKRNWVLFYYPTLAMAQDADMSLEAFENFVFDACLIDWKREEQRQEVLKQVLDSGKQVRIVGDDTDITFSIDGRESIKCFGQRNMPDGEVFIAPVEDSTQGYVHYSFPTIYAGQEVDDIRLVFKDGKVIEATASKGQDLLRELIAMDAGSCKLGEFGIGTNEQIQRGVKQILFDEKIGFSIHLALGMAYREGNGQNESSLHWDMIKSLKENGAIYIDEKCIQKNGRWLIDL